MTDYPDKILLKIPEKRHHLDDNIANILAEHDGKIAVNVGYNFYSFDKGETKHNFLDSGIRNWFTAVK